ncbi:hypothetical protein [Bartonella mastomydis]|nr:hypothetical protein [Bartonella mastomydis]
MGEKGANGGVEAYERAKGIGQERLKWWGVWGKGGMEKPLCEA